MMENIWGAKKKERKRGMKSRKEII